MQVRVRTCSIFAAAALLASLVSACGSSDNGDSATASSASSGEFAPATEAPQDAKKGGDLTVIAASDVDYIDPGATYYQFSYMITGATQSPLVGWAPPDVEQPTPLLAASDPIVSADGKTITYKLRDDVKFSP